MARGLAAIKPRVFPEDPLCAARSRSRPIRENQLDKAGNPVGRKSLIADFVLSGLLPSRCVPQESSLPYRHSQRSKPMLFLPASLLRGGRLPRQISRALPSRHASRTPSPDVAEYFSDEQTLNAALRTLIHAAKRLLRPSR